MRIRVLVTMALAYGVYASFGAGASAQETDSLASGFQLTPGLMGVADEKSSAQEFIESIEISGYIDTAYTYNFNHSNATDGPPMTPDQENPGRIFDRFHNEFSVHNAAIYISKAADNDSIVGFSLVPTLGQDGDVTSSDPNNLVNASGIDVLEANVAIYVPDSVPILGKTTFRMGKFLTTIGGEVIDAPYNDLFSRTHLFGLAIPFTHTGVIAERTLLTRNETDLVVGRIGFLNGWDVVKDNNDSQSVLVNASITPSERFALTLNFITGPENDDNNHERTTLFDVVAEIGLMDDVVLKLNGDWGENQGAIADGGTGMGYGQWYGFAGILRYDFDLMDEGEKKWFIATRGEFFDDVDGSRMTALDFDGTIGLGSSRGEGIQVWDISAAVGFQPVESLLLRTEVRLDKADHKVYDDGKDSAQTTLAFESAFLF